MRKIITLMFGVFSLQAFGLQTFEYKGFLITNYQSNERVVKEERNKLAILGFDGAINHVAIPNTENLRFLKRFSGEQVIFEVGLKESNEYPTALNMAVFFQEDQISYWKNSTENYYNFPQKDALEQTNSMNISGLVKFDGDTVSRFASGFVVVTKEKTLKVAKVDDLLKYTLNSLRGKVATFTISKLESSESSMSSGLSTEKDSSVSHNNLYEYGSRTDPRTNLGYYRNYSIDLNSEGFRNKFARNLEQLDKVEKNLISIGSIIMPMQIGSIMGAAKFNWEDGVAELEIKLSDDEKFRLDFHKEFYQEWSDKQLNNPTLKVNYRIIMNSKGPYPMLESYEILDRSINNNQMEDEYEYYDP